MKKTRFLGAFLVLLAFASMPACSGGASDDDDDDDDGPLPSGTYDVSGATVTDGCGFYGATSYYSSASEVEVTVTSATLDIEGFQEDVTYEINGTVLDDVLFGGTSVFDFTDNASVDYPDSEFPSGNEYACKAQYFVDYRGSITGDASFTLEDEYALVVTSGNECTVALSSAFEATILTLPCVTLDTADFSR